MAKPFISLFNVYPKTIDKGEKVLFRWGVSNATTRHLTLKGDIAPVGSWTVYPASTRTYTLTATNSEGTSEKHQTVTVIQPPAPPPPPLPEPEEPPLPPTPGDCPDFWTDPVGAVLCWIITSIEATLGMVSGGFMAFITYLQQWSAALTVDFWNFLQDPISSIQTWMNGVFVSIQELGNQISTGISNWWTQTVIDVGIMITNATQNFNSWIDENFTNINAWWENIKTVWGTFWTEAITGLQKWVADFTINVNNWYNSNIQLIIDAISSGVDKAGLWIAGFPALIGQWWQDRMVDIGVWIVEATTGFDNFLGDFTGTIGDWWNDRVIEIGVWLADRTNEFNLWVETVLPRIVGNMFEWAKPVIQPIKDAVGFLGEIVGIVTGTAPESESVKAVKKNYKTQTDRINEILEE